MNGKKKVLVTGATGYVGSDLIRKLIALDTTEIAVVIRDIKKAKELFGDSITYILYETLEGFTSKVESFSPHVVIHLGAYSTSSDAPEDVEKLIESNIIFTSHLLLALSGCKIDVFVNTGSFSEFHNTDKERSPTYFYSATKSSARYMIEYFSKRDAFQFVNAILFTVYGKKTGTKKIIDYAFESLNATSSIAMSDGQQELDFVHIDDVVAFYVNIIENYDKLDISQIDYDVGTGESHSIKELVSSLEKLTGKKANIEWGVYTSRKVDTKRACAEIAKTKKDLGYIVKFPFVEGLKKYIGSISVK